ncbi:DUF1360 domain-containing protein [Evansella halocellulosilytica]|uniref:DUF1360 domain-containing protein n=1 Tax=Evansella halocellulosilytica TaxID=2011013 RepID=UPI000BB91BB1|nr:DUF1360 domain-containing protein [Evansella halocellulosilytica]
MEITPFEFILFTIAVFRMTHLFIYDSITEFIRRPFIKVEEETNEHGELETIYIVADHGWKKWVGELLSCHWCLGIWMAVFMYTGYMLFPTVFTVMIIILAAAGVAAMIEAIIIQWL